MNIVIENVEQFKTFFDVVYTIASESIELQLHPDRMVCALLDKSHTRFFHVEFDAKFFDVYAVEDMDSIVVFIEDMHNLLKSCNKTDTLYLEVNDPYLVAKIQSDNGNSRLFEFVLSSDFIDSPVPPHLELSSICECSVGDLKQSLKDINLIGSDLFIFKVADDWLNVITSEDIPTKYTNQIIADFEKSTNVQAGFTLDHVAQMLKFEKISKNVKLKLGQDLPVMYSFEDEIMGVRVTGMIAPRISEE